MLRWTAIRNVVYQLPRNVSELDLEKLATIYDAAAMHSVSTNDPAARLEPRSGEGYTVECEFNYINRKAKMATAYFTSMIM